MIAPQIEGLEHIHAVAAGAGHTIFLDQHGVAWACGSGRHGRLGLGHQRDTAPPEPMRGGEAVMVAVSAGRMHSLLLRGDGVALACGNNKFGQLGAAMEHFDLDHLRFYTGGGSTPAFAGGIRHARLTFPGNVMVPVPVWLPPPPGTFSKRTKCNGQRFICVTCLCIVRMRGCLLTWATGTRLHCRCNFRRRATLCVPHRRRRCLDLWLQLQWTAGPDA